MDSKTVNNGLNTWMVWRSRRCQDAYIAIRKPILSSIAPVYMPHWYKATVVPRTIGYERPLSSTTGSRRMCDGQGLVGMLLDADHREFDELDFRSLLSSSFHCACHRQPISSDQPVCYHRPSSWVANNAS